MMAWIKRLGPPSLPLLSNAWTEVTEYWTGNANIELPSVREKLWAWVDESGGPRPFTDKQMMLARMILCLAYEDNRELEETGFFEDLLNNYGVSRMEINKYNAQNPPSST